MAMSRKEVEDIAELSARQVAEPILRDVTTIKTDIASIAEGMKSVTNKIENGDKDIHALAVRVQTAETQITKSQGWIHTLRIRWRVLVGVFLGIAGAIGVAGQLLGIWQRLWGQ